MATDEYKENLDPAVIETSKDERDEAAGTFKIVFVVEQKFSDWHTW